MPMRMPVHQPVGCITKQERDRAYARTRDQASVVLYHSARWLKARVRFLRSHPLCAECKRNGVIRVASVVDHVDPHRGDADAVPAPIRAALLLIVGHLYENREASTVGVSAELLPMAVDALLTPFRRVGL